MWFTWVSPLISYGARHELNYNDLLKLPADAEPNACVGLLWRNWQQGQQGRRSTLLQAISQSFGGPYWRLAALNLFNDALTFTSTILLNLLVAHLEASYAAASTPAASPAGPAAAAYSTATRAAGMAVHGSNATIPLAGSSGSSSSSGTWWAGMQLPAGGRGPGHQRQPLLLVDVGAWLPWPDVLRFDSPLFGVACAVLLGLTALVKGVLLAQYNYQLSRITCRLRVGLMGCLYRSALLRRHQEVDMAGASGDVSTLMAVDTGRAVNLAISVHAMLSLPLQIGVAMYLLYTQVRYAFVAGVVLTLALIPVNRYLALKIQAASSVMMGAKDARVRIMSQALRGIRVLKMICWEPACVLAVAKARHKELSALAVRKYLDALCVYFWAATQLLFSVLTFGLMALLGQPLTPSVVFTSLALFNVLIAPLNAFPWVINGVVEAFVSINRLEAFLQAGMPAGGQPGGRGSMDSKPYEQSPLARQANGSTGWGSKQPESQYAPGTIAGVGLAAAIQGPIIPPGSDAPAAGRATGAASSNGYGGAGANGNQQQLREPLLPGGSGAGFSNGRSSPPLQPDVAVQLKSATCTWGKDHACLENVSLSIPAGTFTVITGEVGSGKSSLLSTILGELVPQEGSCRLSPRLLDPGRIAYVGQNPWVMNGTVRDNILMGQPYDADRVQQVLHAVALDVDVASWPCGDLTPTGDRGSALSGGQRVRLALARALYQRGAGLFLLDDLLSVVDNHTAQWLLEHALFGGYLDGRTVVMVTKSAAVVRSAHLVVALEHGRIAFVGSADGYADWRVVEGGWDGARAASPPPVATSDDVSPQSLTRALGHGLWHVPASQTPGLAAIEEGPESAPSRTGSSSLQRISSSMGTTPGTLSGAQAAASSSSLAPVQSVASDGMYGGDTPFAAAALEASTAAASLPHDKLTAPTAAAAPGTGGGGPGAPSEASSAPLEPTTEEARAVGHVHWDVYTFYLSAVGWPMVALVVLSLVLMQATKNGTDLWVTFSMDPPDSTPSPNSLYSSLGGMYMQMSKTGLSQSGMVDVASPRQVWAPLAEGVWCPVAQGVPGVSSVAGAMYRAPPAAVAAVGAGLLTTPWAHAAYAPARNSSRCDGEPCTGMGLPKSQQSSRPVQHLQQGGEGLWSSRKLLRVQPPVQRMQVSADQEPASAVAAAVSTAKPVSRALSWQQRWSKIRQALSLGDMDPSMTFFLKGLGVIAAANTLFTLVRAFSFAAAGMSAAARLHQQLLGVVLAAPVTWFDVHPPGRVLNRFSSDTSNVDDSLPFILNIMLANAVSLAGLLAVLGYSQPLLLLVLAPLGVLYRLLQVYYRGTSRQLRRLEAVSLSPLYAAFGEVVEGAPAIRAAGAQGYFMNSFSKLLLDNQLTAMSGAAASNWLTARLQLLAAVLVSAVAGLAAYTSYSLCMEAAAAAGVGGAHRSGAGTGSTWVASALGAAGISSGSDMEEFRVYLLGLCLAYCLPIVALLNGLLTSSAETEQEMVAVERVKEFIDSAVSEEPRVGAQLRRQLSKPLSQQHSEQSWAQRVQRSQSTWWSNSPDSSISPVPSAARLAALRQVVVAGSGRLANAAGYAIGGGLRMRRAAKRAARKPLPSTASLVTGTGLTQPLLTHQPGRPAQEEEQQDSSGRKLGRTVSAPARTALQANGQGRQLHGHQRPQQQQQVEGSVLSEQQQQQVGPTGSYSEHHSVSEQQEGAADGDITISQQQQQQQQQQEGDGTVDEQQPRVSLHRPRGSSGSGEVSVRAESVASGAVSTVSAGNWLMDDTDDSDEEHVTISVASPSGSPRGVRFARGHARGSATSGGMGYALPAVKFEHVTMSYSLAARPALKGVSFEVSLGQTLGVCGRTGAGKSSLLAAVLRLNPIRAGHITLHGQDIHQLHLAELRGRFGVMPQTPLLFEGTVRDNLDPFGNNKDEELASALQAVRLWEVLCRLALERGVLMKGSYLAARRGRSMGLSRSSAAAQHMGVGGKSIRAQAWESISRGDQQEVLVSALSSMPLVAQLEHTEEQQQQDMWRGPVLAVLGMQVAGPGGLPLSCGQKQLLCLARMLLKRSSLVLLDECTASVDVPTAQLMREVLSQQVEGEQTAVIQIAHDLGAIRGYDRVLVMAGGEVVEEGAPRVLEQQSSSHFRQLLLRAHY